MRRWLFFICCLVWVACTANPKDTTSATPQQLPPDINSLELRLSQDMAALGLSDNPPDSMSAPANPSTDSVRPAEVSPSAEAGAVALDSTKSKARPFFSKSRDSKAEKKAEQSQCQRTCDLVDNICDASARICEITDKMPSDPEAPKRCERAKNSCERAKQQGQTCGCSS